VSDLFVDSWGGGTQDVLALTMETAGVGWVVGRPASSSASSSPGAARVRWTALG
jgi:hypothetical protein